MIQSTPPTPPNTSRKRLTIISIVLLLIVIAAATYAYIQQQNSMRDATTVIEDKSIENADVSTDIESLTTELSNGKTATYKNTEGNGKIIFAESDKGMDYVALSHSDVEDFLASTDKELVTRLCGANGERAETENVIVATMSTSARMVEYPTENSCLDELATMRNSDQEIRTQAAEILKQAEADVKAFYGSVIVK